ncbi:MAG: hypothetical protein QOG69_1500, partial [Actinomycetota bacterium]|nr:hypothetical protein [Actinomycetota bacterium]
MRRLLLLATAVLFVVRLALSLL